MELVEDRPVDSGRARKRQGQVDTAATGLLKGTVTVETAMLAGRTQPTPPGGPLVVQPLVGIRVSNRWRWIHVPASQCMLEERERKREMMHMWLPVPGQ